MMFPNALPRRLWDQKPESIEWCDQICCQCLERICIVLLLAAIMVSKILCTDTHLQSTNGFICLHCLIPMPIHIHIYMYQTYYLCCWLFPTWDKPKDCGRQFSGFSCSSFKFGENAADSGNSWCVVTQNFLFVKSRSNFSFNALILSNVEYR